MLHYVQKHLSQSAALVLPHHTCSCHFSSVSPRGRQSLWVTHMAAWEQSLLNVPDRSLGQKRRFLLSLSHGTSRCLLFSSSFLEQWKNKNRWRCRSVCALQCHFPRRISSVHLILKPWRSRLVCCVSTGPGALIPASSHRCPAAHTQTIDLTHHKLSPGATDNRNPTVIFNRVLSERSTNVCANSIQRN